MKFLSRLVDAAGALVIATAVLYFWGYIYYSSYTEAMGVPFHGISISVEEYLTASWLAVGMVVMTFVVIVLLEPVAAVLTDKLADRIRKKRGKPPLTAEERGLIPDSPTAILLILALAAVVGMRLMRTQGQEEAERMIAAAPEVKVWTKEGDPVEGRFIYLRNFGSTLLVKQVSADGKTPLGYRFFKEDAIGSYTLVPKGWVAPVKAKPET